MTTSPTTAEPSQPPNLELERLRLIVRDLERRIEELERARQDTPAKDHPGQQRLF
jgi:hypothetical protein